MTASRRGRAHRHGDRRRSRRRRPGRRLGPPRAVRPPRGNRRPIDRRQPRRWRHDDPGRTAAAPGQGAARGDTARRRALGAGDGRGAGGPAAPAAEARTRVGACRAQSSSSLASPAASPCCPGRGMAGSRAHLPTGAPRSSSARSPTSCPSDSQISSTESERTPRVVDATAGIYGISIWASTRCWSTTAHGSPSRPPTARETRGRRPARIPPLRGGLDVEEVERWQSTAARQSASTCPLARTRTRRATATASSSCGEPGCERARQPGSRSRNRARSR